MSTSLENFLKYISNRTFIFTFLLHTVLYCFHWEHRQVKGVLSAHGGVFKVWRNFPHLKLICYSERGEPRLSFGYKFVGLSWKLLKYISETYIHIYFFSSYSILLFPLRTPASWRSAKCTWRRFKVWRNFPHLKLICYSERGEPRLLFGYKFVGLPRKLLKIYPTEHSYVSFFLHTLLYCFHWEHRQVEGVLSAHGGSLRYKGISHIQNSYAILKGENVGSHLDISLSAALKKIIKIYPTEHSYVFVFCTLYCTVSTENIAKLKEC